MDFTSVAKKLAAAGLTTLSTGLLGAAGPAVASTLCGWLGLDATAADAAAQVESAITDPTILANLKIKAMEHEEALLRMNLEAETARVASDVTQVQAVNETMRSESASEHWLQWAWRPLCGISLACSFFIVTMLVCILAFEAVQAKDMTALNMIPQLVTAFSALFAIIGAVVGVTAWKRGTAQVEQIKAGCTK